MKNARTLFSALALVAIVAVPVAAQAQVLGAGLGQGRWNQQNRRWDNNRYGRSEFQIRNIVDRAERESNAFRASFERYYDRQDDRNDRYDRRDDRYDRRDDRYHRRDDRYDRRDDRYGSFNDAKRVVQRLDESMERLRAEADDRDRDRGRDEARAVLRNAEAVERLFDRRRSYNGNLTGNWNRLKASINQIARAFNLNPVR